jgi:beta-lactamase class A
MAKRWYQPKKTIIYVLLAAVLLGIGYLIWPDQETDKPAASTTSAANPPQQTKTKEKPPFIDLQPTVDSWIAKQRGTASAVIYDLANKKTVGALNPEKTYFTASIYKLYVAYIGYQKIADGTYSANEPYVGDYTRAECLDVMIRESYSPCGEKWWNELGKQNLTEQLKAYGLKNTSMTGLATSAKDVAIILQRLAQRQDLTAAHTKAFLDSMLNQPSKYRAGLPAGFKDSDVYNKVGWNGLVEWHDTAIVTLPSGRSYVVSVLTQNIGSAQVAALGKAIESRLVQ